MDKNEPMSDVILRFEGGLLADGTIRPTITIYCETDAKSPGAFPRMRVAVEIEGWEIGRQIAFARGVLRLTTKRSWRRIGEEPWCDETSGVDKPSRRVIQAAKIDPYRDLVSAMLEEARSLYPKWSELMRDWPLTRLKDSRGLVREFDSAEAHKRKDEDRDNWVENRLQVGAGTPAKRRWRDRKDQLGGVPWAITPGRLTKIDDAGGESVPGAVFPPDSSFQSGSSEA